MLYFAYGSNMLTERLRDRVPSATPVTPATLPNWSLRFHKRSQDGSGKCSIVETDRATVHGVVFDVAPGDVPALDEAEFRGRGYERRRVHPQAPDVSLDAFAYVAQPAYVDDALRPYAWYLALVRAGARQHDLPSDYRSDLSAVEATLDPKTTRRSKHQSLLARAGFPNLGAEA